MAEGEQRIREELNKVALSRNREASTRRGTKQQRDTQQAAKKDENLFNYEGSGEDTSLGELGGSQSTQSVLTSQGGGQTVNLQKTKSVRCDGLANKVPKQTSQSTYSALELNKKSVGLRVAESGQYSKNRSSPVTDRGIQFRKDTLHSSEEVVRFELNSVD